MLCFSPVDPQVTTYILVVNPLAPAKTLCTARREQRGQYGKNSWRAGKLPRHDIIVSSCDCALCVRLKIHLFLLIPYL